MADYTQPDVVSKRVRFFDGQFLEDQDFIDEQKFHLDRERRQSRLLRLTGVSDGLTLTAADEPSTVTVSAGMAVDALGRHLVLAVGTDIALGSGFANQQNVEVRLAYQESPTDVGQTGDGGVGARRWEERPKVVAVAPNGATAVAPAEAPPELEGPTVLLGRLTVAANGDVTVDPTAAHRSSLSMSGGIGIGTASVGSGGLDVGDFDPQDRHLTFRFAADDQRRGGIRFWAGAANQGFSVEYDGRSAAGRGLHVRTHDSDPDGTTRLFVGANGHVGIGTTDLSGADGWGRVVDVVGTATTKLSVRTAKVDGRVMAHDTGMFGAPAGMIVGTGTTSPLTLVTNQAARLTINPAGQVGVGMDAVEGYQLAVRAEHRHLLLRRDARDVEPGRKLVFLELLQADASPPTVPATPLAIRFHHGGRYAYQLEVDPAGFHFRAGDGEYRGIHVGQVNAKTVRIGDVTIGERELKILKKLADNELVCKLRNTYYDSYIWDSGQKRGDSQYRYALTWIPGQPVASHTKTFWQFEIDDQ
ncbi:hypothetical protein [Solwaraspora sp. WMMA2101]|uniref:hypothetical protein n=1 Tax=Solwaraspora sp. WMMA2101 TaxID=3404124 RepID=UPI003B95FA79